VSILTSVRARIAAITGVIVLVLVAGVWVALTRGPAQPAAAAAKPGSSASAQPSVSPLQLVSATPASGSTGVSGVPDITITFSAPVATDSPLPTITPGVAGSWQGAGTDTLRFVPSAAFSQSTHVTVSVPGGPQGVRAAGGGRLGSSEQVSFETGTYQPARIPELLAQLGYLPLTWQAYPGVTVPASGDALGQSAAAYSAPAGTFSWDSGYPSELQNLWDNGAPSSLIIKGAVMAFQSDHNLTMDGVVGPQVWTALLSAVESGQSNQNGYTYAIASEGNPETLTIWHNGQIVQHSLANTGIQVAPTTIGTAPVYLRYRNQIMRGTNPDGTKYADPVQFVAYFRSGEAVHYFPRSSYGWPQSLGCVELTLSDAQHAWPYLTYGSLVTVSAGALTPSGSPAA
jgi:Big-like domain-containing protein/L,D-transpeptidase-like protein/putative peptidoglycan binding protein